MNLTNLLSSPVVHETQIDLALGATAVSMTGLILGMLLVWLSISKTGGTTGMKNKKKTLFICFFVNIPFCVANLGYAFGENTLIPSPWFDVLELFPVAFAMISAAWLSAKLIGYGSSGGAG